MNFTLYIIKSEKGWLTGTIAEMPGAISEAQTLKQLRINMKNALEDLIALNREETKKYWREEGLEYTTEKLSI